MKSMLVAVAVLFSSWTVLAESADLPSCLNSEIPAKDKLAINEDSDTFADVFTFVANSENGREMWASVSEYLKSCEAYTASHYVVAGSDEQFRVLQTAFFCPEPQSHLMVRYDLTNEGAPLCYSMF